MKLLGAFLTLKKVHAWLGAILALFLVVLGLSGAVLVFEDDVITLVYPQAQFGLENSPEKLERVVRAAETHFSDQGLRSIRFGTPTFGLSVLRFNSGKKAYLSASGDVIEQWQAGTRPEEWLFDLHRKLLLGDFGKYLIAAIGLAASIFVVIGLVALWPMRKTVSLRLVPKSLHRRDLLAFHRNIGVLLCLPLLGYFVTGAGLGFSKEIRGLLKTAEASSQSIEVIEYELFDAAAINWHAIFSQSRTSFPGAHISTLSWPVKNKPYANVRLKQLEELHPNGRTNVRFNPVNSEVISVSDALTQPESLKAYNLFYPLHSAKIGVGFFESAYGWLVSSIGILLALVSGFSLFTFIKKRRWFN